MDPEATLRLMRTFLERARECRLEESIMDEAEHLHEAMDASLCLLRWIAMGGFMPKRLADEADRLRELLP